MHNSLAGAVRAGLARFAPPGGKARRPVACLAALVLLAAPAQAQEVWRALGAWTVFHDAAVGGCHARRDFDGTAFAIGFETAGGQMSIVVRLSNPGWEAHPDGTAQQIDARFGAQSPWTLDMTAETVAGAPGLRLSVPGTARMAGLFIEEFKAESVMVWARGEVALGRFSLAGSRMALDAVLACQAETEGF